MNAHISCPVFEISGLCNLPHCEYLHPSPEEWSQSRQSRPLCKKWTQGQCWGCLDRHFYDDIDVRSATTPRDGGQGQEAVTYDSPYNGFTIVKEVARIRREEVDLETGRKKSIYEEKEFEVLDLTKQRSPFAVVGNSNSNFQSLSVFQFPDVKRKTSQGRENTEEELNIAEDSPENASKQRTASITRPRQASLRI